MSAELGEYWALSMGFDITQLSTYIETFCATSFNNIIQVLSLLLKGLIYHKEPSSQFCVIQKIIKKRHEKNCRFPD